MPFSQKSTSRNNVITDQRGRVMKKKSTALITALLTFATCLSHVTTAEAASPYLDLPAYEIKSADLVDPATAYTYYGAGTVRTDLFTRTGNTEPVQNLARTLGANRLPDQEYAQRVYKYIRDNVETVPIFGLQNGALGVLYEFNGTAFDQSELMVQLLRQGNIVADYKFGTLTLNGTQFNDFYGITNAKAACQLLADGGIPATISSTGGTQVVAAGASNCTAYLGNVSSVTMGHAWVYALNQNFDVAYKKQKVLAGIDLGAAMGYNAAGFWTDASVNTESQSVTLNGVTQTVNKVSGIDTAKVEQDLVTYANKFVDTLKASHHTKSLTEVVGGQELDPADQVNISYAAPYSLAANVTIAATTGTGKIPDQYRVKFRVKYADMNKSFYADEIYGLKAIMYSKIIPSSFVGPIQLDYLVIGSNQIASTSQAYSTSILTIEVDHPYAISGFADKVHEFKSFYASTRGDALILSVGKNSSRYVERSDDRVYQEKVSNVYEPNPVRTIAATPIAGKWLAQLAQIQKIESGLSKVVIQHHHSVGLVTSAVESVTPATIDVRSSSSVTARNGNDNDRDIAAYNLTSAANILEGVSLGESQNKPVDSAVASYFKRANNQPLLGDFLTLTKANYLQALSIVTVDRSLTLVQDSIADIEQLFIGTNANDYTVLIPKYNMGWGGILPYLAYRNSGGEISISHMVGRRKGATSTSYDNAYMSIKKGYEPRSNSAIDLARETYTQSGTYMTTGTGKFPSSLSFKRYYQRGKKNDSAPYGWSHNYNITSAVGSDSLRGLGQRSVIDASQSIVGLYVSRQLLAAARTPDRIITSQIVQNWYGQALIKNMFVITGGNVNSIFIKLADGSYNPPHGSAARIMKSSVQQGTTTLYDDRYTWENKAGVQMVFDPSTKRTNSNSSIDQQFFKITSWAWPNGIKVKFWYESNLIIVSNNLGRSLKIAGSGKDNLTVTDDSSRVLTFAGTRTDVSGLFEKYEVTATLSKGTASFDLGKYVSYAHEATSNYSLEVYEQSTDAAPLNTVTFDKYNRILSQKNKLNEVTTYYGSPRFSEIINPSGASSLRYYNKHAQPIKAVDPLGRISLISYYGNGLPQKSTSPVGTSTVFEYDHYGNRTKVTANPKAGSSLLPVSTLYTYDYANHHTLTSVTDAAGNQATYLYNTDGSPQSQTLPAVAVHGSATLQSAKTEYVYKDYTVTGFVVAGGGANSDTTVRLLEKVKAPDGTYTWNNYNVDGTVKETIVDWDALGAGLNLKTTFGYNIYGDVNQVTDHRSNIQKSFYDIRRKPTAVQHPLGVTGNDVEYDYDPVGRLKKVRTASGVVINPRSSWTLWHSSEQVYDALGRVSQTLDNESHTTAYHYDVLNRKNWAVDSEGRKVEAYYNAAGQRVKTVKAPGLLTQVVEETFYNPDGTVASVKDGNGNITAYQYDDFGRQVKVIYPDGSYTQVQQFDVLGRAIQYRDRSGTIFTAVYDALGRKTSRTVTGGDSYSYGYDIMGRARAVNKGLQSVVIDYDALGRPAKEAGVHGKDISYSYDDTLGKQTVYYHDGATDNYSVTYEADALGRMKRVEESRNAALKELANYQYNILGQMTTITYGNGQSIDYSFEPDNDLDKIINTMSGQTVTYDYGHDTTGLTTSKVTTPASYDWTPIYQETQTTTVNNLNQAISINTSTISYDNRGNLTGDGIYALTWSKENLLLNVKKQGVEVGRYTYGPVGRRTEKTNQYGTTKYILSGQNVMSELNGSGALLRRYVYGPGTDQPIAMIKANGSREYYHYDGQGSVIATSGDNGVVVASYVYDSYGRSSDLTGNPYRYAGRRVDIETGFYYNRARYYSPQLGRFLSADPIGYGDGLNMYAYARNNPMNFRDPSGLSIVDDAMEEIIVTAGEVAREAAFAAAI